MAMKWPDRYPGRWDPVSTNYPQGKFKNRTSPTAKDGSFCEMDWANDWAGFFGALLNGAGIVPNGSVDTASVSQLYDALTSVVDNAIVVDRQIVVGGMRNLAVSATGVSSAVNVSVDKISLDNISDNTSQVVLGFSGICDLSNIGAGGLDSGVSAVNTWYSLWAIGNGATGSVIASLSASSPTLPIGYTYRRRIGWIRTDSTANKYPLAFTQKNNTVSYKIGANVPTPRVCASGSTGSLTVWTPVSLSAFTPSTAESVNVTLGGACNNTSAAVAPNNLYPVISAAPIASAPLVLSMTPVTGVVYMVSTCDIKIESMSLYWMSNVPTAHVQINGWVDSL